MTQTTFIGRRTELQRLEEFLKKAAGGQLQIAFIAGEAGAGKSSLVEKFIHDEEEVDTSLIAAIGECNAHTGSGDPYLPFRQVLTSLTTQLPEWQVSLSVDGCDVCPSKCSFENDLRSSPLGNAVLFHVTACDPGSHPKHQQSLYCLTTAYRLKRGEIKRKLVIIPA
ncbi:MAG TPA: ATP-binding protein [Anaerolineales bacterium]